MKKWYMSKTLWLNLIAGLAFLLQSKYGFVLAPEAQAGILAVVNIVLRAITGESIEWKSDAGKLAVLFLLVGSLTACTTIRHTMNADTPESILTAQDVAHRTVYAFESAFKATPNIVDALLQSGKVTPRQYNAQILPAYNQGLASLNLLISALKLAEEAKQDPAQAQTYVDALARFLGDKRAIDNMLAAFGGAQ